MGFPTGPSRGPIGWIAGAIVAAIAVVALGAAFDLGPFQGTELSRGEAIAQGDEICREAHQAFAELQESEPQTAGQAAELTDQLVGIAGDELDRIGSLEAPPDFEAELAEYLEAREEGIAALRDGHQAAVARDSSAYAAAQADVADTQIERRRIAREIGFAICSRPLEAD